MERGPGTGEKLPSKRALARHLEVAVATVENAYSQLVAEGYLYAEGEAGLFCQSLEAGDRPRPAEAVHASGPACALPMPQRDWLLDLTSGGAGTEGFPFTVWARLMRRVLTDPGEQLLRSSPQQGGGAAPGGGQLPAPVPGDHGVAGAGGGGGRDGVPVWADRPAAGPGSELWGGGTQGTPRRGRSTGSTGRGVSPCPGRERRPGRGGGALRGPGGPSVPIPPVPQRRGHAHRPAAEPSALGGGRNRGGISLKMTTTVSSASPGGRSRPFRTSTGRGG